MNITGADVANEKDVAQLAERIGKLWGSPDILVNAAGVYGPMGLVTDVDPAEWQKAVAINLFGTFLTTRAFASLMKHAQNPRKQLWTIINFVGGGEGAYPNFSSYVSAKGGVARFTETVAAELAPYNIAVNAIAPGAVNTKFLDDLIAAGPERAGKIHMKNLSSKKSPGGSHPKKQLHSAFFLHPAPRMA